MALTAQFTIAAACSGGNHFSATLTFSNGQSVTIPLNRQVVRDPITAEDAEAFAKVIFRMFARQMTGTSAAALKTAIEAKVLDLTVVG